MRLKKGSKKEVMNKMVVSAYDGYEEKVSRTFVRPNVSKISLHSLLTGDIVEVCYENSWKVATVLKVLKGGRFLVRLDGFKHEMKVHKANVRTRHEKLMRKIGVKKVKRDKDCSQRHVTGNSFEKIYCLVMGSLMRHGMNRKLRAKTGGMHLLLPMVETGFWFCCLSIGKRSEMFQHRFDTDKKVCCH